MCKIMKLMICNGEFLCRVKLLPISLARVRFRREAAERLKAPGWTRTEYVKQGLPYCRKEINKSNERKISSHFDTNVTQTVFLGFENYCINCIFFDFSLKRLLNQQFAPLKGLRCNCIFVCINRIFRSCIFLLKIHYFLMLLVVKVSFLL